MHGYLFACVSVCHVMITHTHKQATLQVCAPAGMSNDVCHLAEYLAEKIQDPNTLWAIIARPSTLASLATSELIRHLEANVSIAQVGAKCWVGRFGLTQQCVLVVVVGQLARGQCLCCQLAVVTCRHIYNEGCQPTI